MTYLMIFVICLNDTRDDFINRHIVGLEENFFKLFGGKICQTH
jgi:hypothetical protein